MMLSLFLLLGLSSAEAIPSHFSQHGRLMDSTGAAIHGNHGLSFRLYDADVNGNLLWQELLFVDFDNGYYQAEIGTDSSNPIDGSILSSAPLFLEIEVDNTGPLSPRQELNAAPYATMASQAESLQGGTIDATQISVGGALIIDQAGTWVGPTISVGWTDISGIPADIMDGDDDTLASLTCSAGEIASWNGMTWHCSADNGLSEEEIELFITNDAIDLAVGSSINGDAIVSISTDQDSLGVLSCQNGDIAKWDAVLSQWVCDVDMDTQLTPSQVQDFVGQGVVDLAAGSQVNGSPIITVATDADTWLSEIEVESYIENGPIDLSPGTTLNGETIVTSASCNTSGILSYNGDGTWSCTDFSDLVDIDNDNVLVWNDCDDADPAAFNDNGQSAACPGLSCKDILDRGHQMGNGIYWVDPDGGGSYPVYCDMDAGGWTLAMRVNAFNSEFTFNSPHWTYATTLNETNPSDTAPGDAKYQSFNDMPASEIRGCLTNSFSGSIGCKDYPYAGPIPLRELFANTPIGSDSNASGGLYFTETDNERLDWLSIQGLSVANLSDANANYIRTGINIDDDISCYDARVRFGLAINDQPSIISLNDTAGFGISPGHSSACELLSTEDPSSSIGAGLAASTNIETAGTLWLR